jgi:hypothetical protein
VPSSSIRQKKNTPQQPGKEEENTSRDTSSINATKTLSKDEHFSQHIGPAVINNSRDHY